MDNEFSFTEKLLTLPFLGVVQKYPRTDPYMKAPLPCNENDRLSALRQYKILDTDPEKSFDDLTFIASFICQTPIALVSIVDEDRQWFKSRVGLDVSETSRDVSFCAHTILAHKLMVVADTMQDVRFLDNPLVIDDPKIRFYAGAPFYTPEGHPLGTLCVIARTPKTLSEEQQQTLQALSRQVSTQLEFRRNLMELKETLNTITLLGRILPICAACKKIRDKHDNWYVLESYLKKHTEVEFTHRICPDCAELLYHESLLEE